MTDVAAQDPSALDERVALLQARRAAAAASTADRPAGRSSPQGRGVVAKRHVAARSRFAAAGLGAGAMFGIMSVLGMGAAGAKGNDPYLVESVPTPAPARPITVVIHQAPVAAGGTAVEGASPAALPTGSSSEPIVLTARPVVRTITVQAPASGGGSAGSSSAAAPAPAPAPAPRSNGSR